MIFSNVFFISNEFTENNLQVLRGICNLDGFFELCYKEPLKNLIFCMSKAYGKVGVREDIDRRFTLSWKASFIPSDDLERMIVKAQRLDAPASLKYEIAMSFGTAIAGLAGRYCCSDPNFFQHLCAVGADMIIDVLRTYDFETSFSAYYCGALRLRFGNERNSYLTGWNRGTAKTIARYERVVHENFGQADLLDLQAEVIAKKTGMDVDHVRKAQTSGRPMMSLDEGGRTSLADDLSDDVFPDPDIETERADLGDRIRALCKDLSLKQRILLRQLFGVRTGPFSRKSFCEGLHFKAGTGAKEYDLAEVDAIFREFREKVAAFCEKPTIKISESCLGELSAACRSFKAFEKFLKSDLRQGLADILYGIMWPKEMCDLSNRIHKSKVGLSDEERVLYISHIRKAVALSSLFNIPPITEFPTQFFAEDVIGVTKESISLCTRTTFPVLKEKLAEYEDSVRNPANHKNG